MAKERKMPPNDPYAQQYEEQLREFNKLAGSDGGQADLKMHSMSETFAESEGGYGPNGYGQAGQPQGQNTYNRPVPPAQYGQNEQRQAQRPYSGDRQRRPAQGQRPSGQRRPQKSSQGRQRVQAGKSTPAQRQKGRRMEEQTKKKKNPILRFFKTVFILAVVLFFAANALLIRYIMLVNVKPSGERAYTSGALDSSDVTNILVIGSDTRSADEYGRTDSMILLSVNKKSKEITMTSFMRDMYVEIKGNDLNGESVDFWDKLNAAYVHGGAELLMDTIEYNFDISVDDYVYIDFFSFVDIVDAVGGIELEVTAAEAEGMRAPMAEQNKILGNKKGTDYLTDGGKYNMNGNRALAYARLRYVGNADFQRTERQREVISKVIEKVKHSNPVVMDRFAKTALSDLVTNMGRPKLVMMAYKALFSANYEIKSLRIPADGCYEYGWHDGQSTLDIDLNAAKLLLKSEIYG